MIFAGDGDNLNLIGLCFSLWALLELFALLDSTNLFEKNLTYTIIAVMPNIECPMNALIFDKVSLEQQRMFPTMFGFEPWV